jgi:PHD/YefM family antitoxin component YafN of YafNO toxin-antitoxin module
MIELSELQCAELNTPEPVAIDPHTNETYVLVKQAAYQHLKSLLALGAYDPDEGAAHVNEIMADDDANDPLLESYQLFGRASPS